MLVKERDSRVLTLVNLNPERHRLNCQVPVEQHLKLGVFEWASNFWNKSYNFHLANRSMSKNLF
jgi:hypothetical protein